MTVQFPDVSNHQGNLSLSGAAACIAKASEGTTFRDQWYTTFKAKAAVLNIPFAGYHWLHAADVPAQARLAFSVVGPNTPLMIDDEDPADGLSISRTLAFVKAYRALGGVVTMEYLPRWYWQREGSPDLRPLAAAGLSLVSSNYSQTYSDNGIGFQPYGGVTPTIWQYTSNQIFNGQRVDFNGFPGTIDQLKAVFNGHEEESDMSFLIMDDSGRTWLVNEEATTRSLIDPARIHDRAFWVPGMGGVDDRYVMDPEHAGQPKRFPLSWLNMFGGDITPPTSSNAGGGGASAAEVKVIVRAELDKTKLGS